MCTLDRSISIHDAEVTLANVVSVPNSSETLLKLRREFHECPDHFKLRRVTGRRVKRVHARQIAGVYRAARIERVRNNHEW